jgi:hypothetical protein
VPGRLLGSKDMQRPSSQISTDVGADRSSAPSAEVEPLQYMQRLFHHAVTAFAPLQRLRTVPNRRIVEEGQVAPESGVLEAQTGSGRGSRWRQLHRVTSRRSPAM